MFLRGSRPGALTVLIVMALALAACGSQSPATQEPDPASWFVGQDDRTTPAPPQVSEASLALGDSVFQPATLVVKAGATLRIENMGTEIHVAVVDGIDLVVLQPGGSKVVPINLEPGRYTLSVRGDPATIGTLVVT